MQGKKKRKFLFCILVCVISLVIILPVSASIQPDYSVAPCLNGWNYTLLISPDWSDLNTPCGIVLTLPDGLNYVSSSLPSSQVRYNKDDACIYLALLTTEPLSLSLEGNQTGTVCGELIDYLNQRTLPIAPMLLDDGTVTSTGATIYSESTSKSEKQVTTPGFSFMTAFISLLVGMTGLIVCHRRRT